MSFSITSPHLHFCPGFSNREICSLLTAPVHPSFIVLHVTTGYIKAANLEVLGFVIVTVTHDFDQ